ncbi:MAG: glycine cleavage system protein R [Gammaproteobacteria bacterium]|nr:MAG: glycine cleavage system protein R [Gammaproteobacteria bacterium]
MRLVISILADDRTGIVREITDHVLQRNCNILDSQMATLEGIFAMNMLVEGEPMEMAALEQHLWQEAEEGRLSVALRKSTPPGQDSEGKILDIHVSALDHPGIVNGIARFFSDQGINILRMETRAGTAPHTASPTFTVSMRVLLPSDIDPVALRRAFGEYCEEAALDCQITHPSGEAA